MTVLYKGSCNCNQWQVEMNIAKPLSDLSPRFCDCDYCQINPSRIISDPSMLINLLGGEVTINQNGDKLANFYYCSRCCDLLVVGCILNGQLRGAVNASLLSDSGQLGKAVKVQPRLLSASEKLNRWESLWGVINGL